MDELPIKCTRMYMYDELRDGMLRQITLIEQALGRKLQDEELLNLKELRDGLFYISPDDIVQLTDNGAHRVSFFSLDQEIREDVILNYSEGV